MKEKQDYFDKAAHTWDEKPSRVALAKAVASAIKENIPLRPNMKSMEYGCGTGLVTMLLSPYLGHIMAVDTSPEMLRVLEEKITEEKGVRNVSTMQIDLSGQDFKADLFPGGLDLIFTSMTLHHIGPVEELIRRFSMLLNSGGWLAVADLDKEDGSFHGKDVPGVKHHGFDRDELKRLMARLGFYKIKAVTAHEMTKKTGEGRIKTYPVFLIRAKKQG